MADWDKITSRGSVEDRRAMGGGIALGGAGLVGTVIVIIFSLLSGGGTVDILQLLQNIPVQVQQTDPSEFEGLDDYEKFASTIIGSTDEMWTDLFRQSNKTYTPPKLVLFRGLTQSACGGAMSAIGPHYCPADKTIYLDETFFEELSSRYGAKGGDVAQAYVIAHEAAHHAQNLLGVMDQVEKLSTNEKSANQASVKLELQADCFAGLWANSIRNANVFEPGEIEEAIDAAAAVGDDRIQQRSGEKVNAESWTHGSSEQRVSWFTTGFEKGNLSACNTF